MCHASPSDPVEARCQAMIQNQTAFSPLHLPVIAGETPTPTPRTDAIAHRGLSSVAYIAEMTSLCRQLERELADKDAHADEIYKTAVNLAAKLEDDLAAERALAARLAQTLANVQFDYVRTGAIVLPEVDTALAAWKEARSATC